jgi:hypothetical protein
MGTTMPTANPRNLDEHAAASLERLASASAPWLIGVRHHSPALAAAIPELLASYQPTVILLELPTDLQELLPWLSDPATQAPVALAAAPLVGEGVSFYPFADFSPELAAVRWARAANVPVIAIDRAVGAPLPPRVREAGSDEAGAAADAGRASVDIEELWDRLVEGHAPSRAPNAAEAIRRGALLFGWMTRNLDPHVPTRDLLREVEMRRHVQNALKVPGARPVAIVGSFHAEALLAGETDTDTAPPAPVRASIVPYDFALFDSRSGYPAGIRDPALVQALYEQLVAKSSLEPVLAGFLVAIAREVRQAGHVASFADVREAARIANELSTLRNLPAPGRRELLEAIESAMLQGETLGRGRVVAKALEAVLVGQRRGRLPPGAPRSGLATHVDALFEELRLPGLHSTPKSGTSKKPDEITLDPLRSPLDAKRAIAIARLTVCGIPYAERRHNAVQGARGTLPTLTKRYRLKFTPETAARLELASLFGITLAQAAEGELRAALRRATGSAETASHAPAHALVANDAMTVGTWLELAEQAAEAALPALVDELFARLNGELIPSASFAELVALLAFVGRIVEEHIVGLATSETKPQTDFPAAQEALLAAALAALAGVEGSTQDGDVQAFAEVVALYTDREEGRPVPLLLTDAIRRFSEQGSPLLRGAALAAHALLDEGARAEFSNIFVSFFQFGTDDANGAQERSGRIRGALVLGGPRFEGDPAFTDAVLAGIDSLEESAFLRKLPSLRRGFDVLSAAGRQRMLDALGEGAGLLTIAADPSLLAFGAEADAAGSAAVVALCLGGLETRTALAPTGAKKTVKTGISEADGRRLTLADRLRLLLGREAERLSGAAAPFGRALDELYGQGHGEGSRDGGGAGRGAPFPTAREWADELTTLFGDRVREEVLGAAAEAGYGAAATALDPETVQPSVALLEQLLALRGGLGEKDLAHLRKLIEKIVSSLARELATRIRPALSGLATPRPSRRARGPLDLRRTIRENLGTARPRSARAEDGYALTPKDFFFKTRAKKSVDWQVVLLVDVSGSMEPSTIYAALVASILAKIPALSTKFITFSDGVVDLSEHVDDPLELLLGIGGGTNIGGAIRFARTLARVPSRTLLVCVSDFEEGASVPTLIAEVRDVVGSGITALGLAALDDRGAPRFHRGIAERVAGAGMPIAALSPEELAGWIGERVRGR